jgi:oligoribonuclease NrnB/cAMP/cGMP phosphodiesterase (DHH superfamily)
MRSNNANPERKKKMKCFYHRDMDGKCAAAIVFQSVGIRMEVGVICYPPEFISIDYKDTLDLKTILPNEQVWIVDFSFKPEVMEELLKITEDITWIDHHKTAMEYKYSQELAGIRDNNFSGCELTWKYIHPKSPMPKIVEMLGRYDVWDFSKYGDSLNQLQAGIRLFSNEPSSGYWEGWLQKDEEELDRLSEILNKGIIALQYRDNYYSGLIKGWSFFTEFEGYKAICCNAGSVSSQLFDSVKEDYDLMIPFAFDGKQWTVSLYTKKDIDCSEIAKKYGGGGHKGAAGFQCKELPFHKC